MVRCARLLTAGAILSCTTTAVVQRANDVFGDSVRSLFVIEPPVTALVGR